MSAWKKPSRNTCVKKIVDAVARQLLDVDAGVAQPLELADRHAVHALHHDHVCACTGPSSISGTSTSVEARPCCGAAARRWPPRAPGRARRAGTCRTRPPPRAASGACRRPTAARPSAASVCISARSFVDRPPACPGRSTLTATSRPSLQRARSAPARSTRWPPARRRTARRPRRPAGRSARSTIAIATCAPGNGGTRSCSLRELVGDVGRQQVAPRRQHLAELDEDRPQPLQRLAQPHAARRVEACGRT